jgi:hypothetical protein
MVALTQSLRRPHTSPSHCFAVGPSLSPLPMGEPRGIFCASLNSFPLLSPPWGREERQGEE